MRFLNEKTSDEKNNNCSSDNVEWIIPVTWEMYGAVTVSARTLKEAVEIAEDEEGIIPIPTDAYYVDGSWSVTDIDQEEIRELYNDGRPDKHCESLKGDYNVEEERGAEHEFEPGRVFVDIMELNP